MINHDRVQITRNVFAFLVPPILVGIVRSTPEIGYDSFSTAVFFYTITFYPWAALYGGLSYAVLWALNSSGTWWKYCLLVFLIAFAEDVYSKFRGFGVFGDYTFEHMIIVKAGQITEEGKIYLVKQAFLVSVLYSLGFGLIFLIQGKATFTSQTRLGRESKK